MAEFCEPFDLPEGDEQRKLHIGRYEWAKEMIKGYVVANAACSTNYGYEILRAPLRLVVGFDRNPVALALAHDKRRGYVIERDIQDETFDGFTTLVCLETLEHLERPWSFLKELSPSVTELVLSAPIIPTKHFNEWHLHDFTKADILDGLKEQGWRIKHWATQNEDGLPSPTYLLIYAIR